MEQELYVKGDTDGEYVAYTPPAFLETLPEDIRGDFEGVEDANQLATNYLDLKGKVPVVPETADAYDMDIPEGTKVDEQAVSEFREVAHKLGLSQEQLKGIMEFDLNRAARYDTEFKDQIEANREAAKTALKDGWLENYDTNLSAAHNTAKMALGEDGYKAWEEAGLLDDTNVIHHFHKLSTKLSPDTWESGAHRPPGPKVGEDGEPLLEFPSMDKKA